MSPQIILVTGCSSGIGRSLIIEGAKRGHIMLASAPASSLLADIPDQAHAKYVIDVCDEATIAAAVSHIVAKHGRIDVLVNNAGYLQAGPVERVPAEKVEQQFAVNVFGQLSMIRHVAPVMRSAGKGRILNIASLMGLVSLPMAGIYSASKFAVEGFSDALRMELKPFGVDVVLVEPGFIKTNLAANARAHTDTQETTDASNPYHSLYAATEAKAEKTSAIEGSAEDVCRVVLAAIETESPKPRYKVTAVGKLLPVLRNILPSRVFDQMVISMMT